MGSVRREVRGAVQEKTATRGWRAALVEMAIILLLYVAYSSSRLFASDALRPAQRRAAELLDIESALHLSWEGALNQVFAVSRGLSLFGSLWYATAHYVVTAVVLVWLYRRGAAVYVPARRALVVATVIALVAYLLLPTAPPRLFGGYADVLALTSGDGWWGGDASAPKGLGGLTNQLAAFPSLHAGWALWVAMVLQKHGARRWMRIGGWMHALITGLVVVGTGNHWVADVLIGWLVIWLGFKVTSGITLARVSEALERLAYHVGIRRGPHRRQAGLEETAVPRGDQPRVEHGHHATVGGSADQPTAPLRE
jgi:PAP2 superfamily protein